MQNWRICCSIRLELSIRSVLVKLLAGALDPPASAAVADFLDWRRKTASDLSPLALPATLSAAADSPSFKVRRSRAVGRRCPQHLYPLYSLDG